MRTEIGFIPARSFRTPVLGSLVALVALSAWSCGEPWSDPSQPLDTTIAQTPPWEPVEIAPDETCEDLFPGTVGFTIEMPPFFLAGSFPWPWGGSWSIGATMENGYFDWASDMGLDGVLTRAGEAALLYAYDPESYGDTGLHLPEDPSTGEPFLSGEIEFCHDYDVWVTQGITPTMVEALLWGVAAVYSTPQDPPLVLSPGQIFSVQYQVDLSTVGVNQGDWQVAGQLLVQNPSPNDVAMVEQVVQEFGGIPVEPDCGVAFPHEIPPLGSLACEYGTPLPDGSTRTGTATVLTTGPVKGGEAVDLVDFAEAGITHRDACVEVHGVVAGALPVFCGDDVPVSFPATVVIGPFSDPDDCGLGQVSHTVTIIGQDSGIEQEATWSVPLVVPCETGCTLSPGYWKTHSSHGPAPYDDTWAWYGEESPFYDTGQNLYEVLWTPPKGNAYYILAHAYGAAHLNAVNGADTQAVTDAMLEAAILLGEYDGDPFPMSAIRGGVRHHFLALAQILDDYNNGLIGPGSCSE